MWTVVITFDFSRCCLASRAMKTSVTLFVLFLWLSTTDAVAQWKFNNDGSRIFDMRKNKEDSVRITIQSANQSQVKEECQRKSIALGNGGFKEEMLACTFWQGSKCHIIVAHKVDMRTIGHEVMHCFQGSWHN
jgi:hypothetical protein